MGLLSEQMQSLQNQSLAEPAKTQRKIGQDQQDLQDVCSLHLGGTILVIVLVPLNVVDALIRPG
jgi:hypothetical protein